MQLHAHTFVLSDFVSIENKGAVILITKLKVASSSLVTRSRFPELQSTADRIPPTG